EVYINNQLIPGGPFNSIEGFVNALLNVYPEFEFAYSTITPGSFSLIAWNNPSILFETITFVDILTTITHSYDFGPCYHRPSSEKLSAQRNSMFSGISNNFHFSYTGNTQTGNP